MCSTYLRWIRTLWIPNVKFYQLFYYDDVNRPVSTGPGTWSLYWRLGPANPHTLGPSSFPLFPASAAPHHYAVTQPVQIRSISWNRSSLELHPEPGAGVRVGRFKWIPKRDGETERRGDGEKEGAFGVSVNVEPGIERYRGDG